MSHPGQPAGEILLAGATGALGQRIARALRNRGAAVRAIVRPGTAQERVAALQAQGVIVMPVDLDDEAAITSAATGAACVVSALNGLEDVILGQQGKLLRGAVAAGVPRFIPSDFSMEIANLPEGSNRNLNLRRAFHRVLDKAPIRATSILNGAFADLLTGAAPFILFPVHRVVYFGSADQELDFTTMDDVAAFTAAAALDPDTPRVLRIAGDVVSARSLAEDATAATGMTFRPMRAGSLRTLRTLIGVTRALVPGRGQVFPPWQGMQYMRDMFSGAGKLTPLDNGRYPELQWTKARTLIADR